jgi:hypothetical protein
MGRRRDFGLGGLSVVSLAEAREEATKLRKIVQQNCDPLAERVSVDKDYDSPAYLRKKRRRES